MPKVLRLPSREEVEVDAEELRLADLLSALGYRDLEGVVVVVNDRVATDPEMIIKRRDRVVVVEEGPGG